MARRGLTLRKSEVVDVDYQWAGAFRLRVAAGNPRGGMDPNVFLWQRLPVNQYTGTAADTVLCVASTVDMESYPVGEPGTGLPERFFRLDYFEVDLPSVSLADEVWATVLREVDLLCRILDKLEDGLTAVAEVEVGAPPPDGGSSESASLSSSASASASQSLAP